MPFWRPGTAEPGSSLDRATEIEGNMVSAAPISSSLPFQLQRDRLPISKHLDKILYSVENYGVVILLGQTGCGKTTQVPQFLYEAGWAANGKVIVCTQPRRVAATSVACRVADEMGSKLGDKVGYTIRFEDLSDKTRTRILYVTDGILFREMLVDPLLYRYSIIMIDEAHERNIYTDLLLGLLKKIRRKRPSLHLIISSATLDATAFSDYFNGSGLLSDAVTISIEGKAFPVQISYIREPTPDYVFMAAQVSWEINLQREPGDILIFLTGRGEINRCLDDLSERIPFLPVSAPRIVPLALHAGLSIEDQLKVFRKLDSGHRKIIISTNIAEASITIDGIKYVVDCGFVKLRNYNPSTALTSLVTVPISMASAIQRAGRAGRNTPGVCYRLYPESVLDSLPRSTSPEVSRCDMTTPILQLKSLGVNDLMKFEWVSSPPSEIVVRALEGLVNNGMVSENGDLTAIGAQVAEFPVEVNIAKMLFNSQEYGCGEEILTIAAMTAVQDIFLTNSSYPLAEMERRKFTAEEGDHLTFLNAYNAFIRHGQSLGWCKSHALSFRALSRVMSIRAQLRKYMQRFRMPLTSCKGDAQTLRRCLVSGYWRNGAKWMADGTYRSLRGNMVLEVHPNSVLFSRKPRSGWVIFHEMEETKTAQIRIITEIEPEWLVDHGHKYL